MDVDSGSRDGGNYAPRSEDNGWNGLGFDRAPQRTPVSIEIRIDDRPLSIVAVDGVVRVTPGSATAPDAVVTGPPDVVLAALLGRLTLTAARRRGLRTEGNASLLARFQPASEP